VRKIFYRARSLFTYITGGLFFFLSGLIVILFSFFPRGALFEHLLKIISKSILFIAGIKVNISGVENFNKDDQYIVMMNHVNIFDAFLFYSSFPGFARGVEEESHFRWPFYGWVMKRIGMIPINRKRGREALETLKRAAGMIRERPEYSIAVLPEGTRTRTGMLGNFKKGGFLLAVESGLDILPVIQTGSFDIKKKGRSIIRPGIVELEFNKPVSVSGFSRNSLDKLIKKTRGIFEKKLNQN